MNQDSNNGNIITQEAKENGIWITWESGFSMLVPYSVDEEGNRFMEIWPNE